MSASNSEAEKYVNPSVVNEKDKIRINIKETGNSSETGQHLKEQEK